MNLSKKALFFLFLFFFLFSFFFLLYFSFDLSFENIQNQKAQIKAFLTMRPFLGFFLFFLSYMLFIVFFLPGTSLLSLLGGYFFGFWKGLILVSFASSLGVTLTFLIARFYFRLFPKNSLLKNTSFRKTLDKIRFGFEKEGSFYLFSLRQISLLPFFFVNIGMALTSMKTFRFFWVSQLRMLPGTIVLVKLGLELSDVRSVQELFSIKIMCLFILLALLPWVVRALILFLRKKRGFGVL